MKKCFLIVLFLLNLRIINAKLIIDDISIRVSNFFTVFFKNAPLLMLLLNKIVIKKRIVILFGFF